MKWFAIVTVLLVSQVVRGQSFGVGDIVQSAKDAVTGVAAKIPDAIPSAEDMFQSAKNVIAGYPFDAAFSAINLFCSTALSAKQVSPKILPEINKMNFVLKTKKKNITVPLQKPDQLWAHAEFNPKLPVVIFVTGWTTNLNESENSALDTVFAAYKCRGGVNFVAVDTAEYVDTLYTWSAFNTEDIGALIAVGLEKLIRNYPMENIHLIGHSLGAHMVGAAGRNLSYKTDKLLKRITGLDPANPCFNEGENLSGLARGDAEFVDIIHSNPGALGKRDSIGDVDFYPNGLDPLPPGCLSITCAHGRAWEYYAESVYPGNEKNFMGVKCGSLTALSSGYCPGKEQPMGYAVPMNLKGNFFLKTNAESPYGMSGSNTTKPTCSE